MRPQCSHGPEGPCVTTGQRWSATVTWTHSSPSRKGNSDVPAARCCRVRAMHLKELLEVAHSLKGMG
jgi:hypothetical protein